MCGRYQLELGFGPEFRRIRVPKDYRPTRDARPTHLMPIVRFDDQGEWVAELRRWGFLRKCVDFHGVLTRDFYLA